MRSSIKAKLPFSFLFCMSIGWAFYYQSNSQLNDYGKANFEWLFLVDALITLPIICFVCVKDKKEAIFKAIVLVGLAVLMGSYIIPEQSKVVWHYLEYGRYGALAVILLSELVMVVTVCLAIKSAIYASDDPDDSIERPILRYLGERSVATLIMFEMRMWTFALFARRVQPEHFRGQQHFSYHNKDGAQSNLQGFIFLMAFEMPIVHVVLHFTLSPFIAAVITLFTLLGMVFFVAEYRAVSRRPISLVGDALFIRYGLYQPCVIPLEHIANIQHNNQFVRRAKHVKRYNYSGYPNIEIELARPMGAVTHVYIGIDHPELFMQAVLGAKYG